MFIGFFWNFDVHAFFIFHCLSKFKSYFLHFYKYHLKLQGIPKDTEILYSGKDITISILQYGDRKMAKIVFQSFWKLFTLVDVLVFKKLWANFSTVITLAWTDQKAKD